MSLDPSVTRRTLLVAGAATAGVAALAACSGSDDSSPSAEPSSPSEASSSAPASSSEAGSSAASSSAGGSSPAGDSLASLADLTVGEPTEVDLPDGKKGLLTKTSATAVACFSNVCTHEGCSVAPDGKQLACPCHQSTFNASTGAVLGGPAPSPLAKVNVKVVDGQVFAG